MQWGCAELSEEVFSSVSREVGSKLESCGIFRVLNQTWYYTYRSMGKEQESAKHHRAFNIA